MSSLLLLIDIFQTQSIYIICVNSQTALSSSSESGDNNIFYLIECYTQQSLFAMFNKIVGAVAGLAQKIQQSFASQPQSNNPRLGSYIDFQLSESVMSYITVDDKRLYYQSYNPEETVKGLQDQFRQFTGRDLTLESDIIHISPDMPLTNIIKSNQTRNVFEQIINKIDKNQKITHAQISHQKEQALKEIIKACNSFSSYNAKIVMYNGLLKPIQLGMKVEASTTFRYIISEMNKHPLIAGQDIIFESEQRVFEEKLYDRTFQELNIKERDFVARYTNRNSFVRGDTLVTVPTGQQTVEIRELNGLYDKQIVCYDSFKGKAIINRMINSQTQEFKQFYRLVLVEIQVSEQKKEVILECTGEVKVYVLTEDFDEIWVPVKKLKAKDRVNCISRLVNKINIYEVKDVEKVALEKSELFYGIQVAPYHQYIANSIIIHNNNNKFTITAIIISDDYAPHRKRQITFLRHQKISKYFKNSTCYLGGLHLKNSQTFGDYQIEQFDLIYVYEASESILSVKKDREIKVTEYKNKTFDKKEFEKVRQKMEQSYFAIYNERIIGVKYIHKIIEKEVDSDANILVSKRTPFERLNYLLNKEPVYAKQELQVAQRVFELKKDDPAFKTIRQRLQTEKSKVSEMTALGMFMYTLQDPDDGIPHTPFYQAINGYLRSDYLAEKIENENIFMPMIGWVMKSTKQAELYTNNKLLYRGISNCKLDKIFNLKDEQIKQYQVIIFTAFTSTTENFAVAKNFGKDILLTLKVRSGRQIEKYSNFQKEKEVLLSPFTYFVINSYNLGVKPQTAEIQEVPLPWTSSNEIIFWVDDNPQNNNSIIKYCLEPQGIEVVQVISTRIMKVILKNFFWIYKMLNKKVVIVSDMVRIQDGIENKFAGIDLFQSIFNEYGLSNKAIIFASDKQRATKNLNQRNLEGSNWFVTSNQQELISEIMLQFKKF